MAARRDTRRSWWLALLGAGLIGLACQAAQPLGPSGGSTPAPIAPGKSTPGPAAAASPAPETPAPAATITRRPYHDSATISFGDCTCPSPFFGRMAPANVSADDHSVGTAVCFTVGFLEAGCGSGVASVSDCRFIASHIEFEGPRYFCEGCPDQPTQRRTEYKGDLSPGTSVEVLLRVVEDAKTGGHVFVAEGFKRCLR